MIPLGPLLVSTCMFWVNHILSFSVCPQKSPSENTSFSSSPWILEIFSFHFISLPALRFCHTKGLSGIATEILFTLVKAARCGITVAVCVKAMKQLVFYVSFPPQTAGWLLGAVSSYSTRGPSLYYNGVRQAEQFQPSCKCRNETKSGYSDAVANKENFSGPFWICILWIGTISLKIAVCAAFLKSHVTLKSYLSVDSDRWRHIYRQTWPVE